MRVVSKVKQLVKNSGKLCNETTSGLSERQDVRKHIPCERNVLKKGCHRLFPTTRPQNIISSSCFHPGKQQHGLTLPLYEIFMAEMKQMKLKDCVYLSERRLHRWDPRSRLGVWGWLVVLPVDS